MPKPTLIVITGATATGKTALAIRLAQHFDTEILSADSRQFYRELTIGTAKPTTEQLQRVKHHFINTLTLDQDYNISRYEKEALECLDQLFLKKNVAILCGGSGLYIQAICRGMDPLPESDPELRKQLSELLDTEGITALQKKLQELDPDFFSLVDHSNPHRMIRAIEVCMLTGKKYSGMRKGETVERNFRIVKIGLDVERGPLYANINTRVNKMMEEGLEEEARKVYPLKHLNSLNTVGYKELFDYFDGKTDLETATTLIRQNTRNYAKRQLTWFRRDPEIKWFDPTQEADMIAFLEQRLQG